MGTPRRREGQLPDRQYWIAINFTHMIYFTRLSFLVIQYLLLIVTIELITVAKDFIFKKIC